MRSSRHRLWAVAIGASCFPVVIAFAYMALMAALEGEHRDFWQSLEWASETLTTTGYGADSHWSSPAMVVFVVLVQFLGVALTFVMFSLVVVPFFEERFEGRLPREVGRVRNYVLVYRFGAAVSSLLEELERAGVPTVVLEEDEAVARRLLDRGRQVVYFELEAEDPDPQIFRRARAIIANGTDQQNGALVLSARQQGYEGEIIALADQPLHRKPMMLAGATAVYTPLHILAAAIAALASERVSPRVAGMHRVGGLLHTAELRIHPGSELAGKSLAEVDVRARTGATIIGQWRGGVFEPHPSAREPLGAGAILVAVGSERALDALGKIAATIGEDGPLVVCGFGEVGHKLRELLGDAGEELVVIDKTEADGVDVVGDVLDQQTLEAAGVRTAKGVILALADDSTTLFAASVLRDYAPHVPIIARVNRAENVERIHRAGADFALSLGEVAAEMLAQKMLGDAWLSLEARVKVVRVAAAGLEGSSPAEARVGQQTGCSVVGVEREGTITVDFPRDFRIEGGDHLYVCGTEQDVDRYFASFPGARLE